MNTVSRAQAQPSAVDWEAVIRIFEYLKSTIRKGLRYDSDADNISCFVDASSGTNDENARSTSGHVSVCYTEMSLLGAPKSRRTWHCRPQRLSIHIAASFAYRQLVSIKKLVKFAFRIDTVPVIFEDNKSAIVLAKSDEAKSLKHVMKLCYHYLRFEIRADTVTIQFVGSKDQIADIFTKALLTPTFDRFRNQLVYDMP